MISVRNHRLRLNGSKFLFFLLVIFLVSCSRKVVPPIKHPDDPGELPKQAEQPVIVLEPQINSIGLILPFYSERLNASAVEVRDLERAGLALDFYQGFKLALDSLAQAGGHFQLEVLDAGDDERKLTKLAQSEAVLNKDLLIGPVFPEGIRLFSDLIRLQGKVMVSPLAASSPKQYKNPALVTLNNGIDQHAARIAEYISKIYDPGKVNVVLINTRSADAQKFALPFKKELAVLASDKFQIHEVPNTKGIEQRLLKSKTNVVIIASDEQEFVMPSVYRLYRLKADRKYPVDVFGHPNWTRLNLDVNQLQTVNARITSSYHIDYSSESVRNFVSRFRKTFWEEPSEYAFKGFDTGYYFGSLLMKYGKEYAQNIGSTSYHGLHSDFLFSYDGQYGFRNINLTILQYKGFDLVPVP